VCFDFVYNFYLKHFIFKEELSETLSQQEEEYFYQQIGLKFEEETSEMLHFEHGFVWCCNLDASGSRSETRGKF
jgi:hypothetical protein